MINFPGNITIEACEKIIADMVNGKNSEVLQLPVKTKGYAISFGGLASAIQAVNTWARISNVRALKLTKGESINAVEDMINKPHKFVAGMFAKSIMLANEAEVDLRPQINSAAKQAIENQAQSQFGQQRGGLCWFAFVDHSSKGFDPNFYIAKADAIPEPRQPEQFKAIIQKMIGKAMAAPGGGKDIAADDLDALGRIFYELFLNTHEHGTRDRIRKTWLKPGVRIVYVQGINFSKIRTKGAIENQPILSHYFQAVSKRHMTDGQSRFVEIGIVDSGLGYCDRWVADKQSGEKYENITIEDEYSIFKQCFNFRQTSTSKDSKGNGLPIVMDRLTKLGGFMRIRSGRLGLFRNFISSPYLPGEQCTFFDWENEKSADLEITSMPKVCGAAISLLIPLEAK